MTYAEKRKIVTLRRYYEIYGDGVARVKLDKIVKSPRFQRSLKSLYALKLD